MFVILFPVACGTSGTTVGDSDPNSSKDNVGSGSGEDNSTNNKNTTLIFKLLSSNYNNKFSLLQNIRTNNTITKKKGLLL